METEIEKELHHKVNVAYHRLELFLKRNGKEQYQVVGGFFNAFITRGHTEAIADALEKSDEELWEVWNSVPHIKQELINGECVTTVIE